MGARMTKVLVVGYLVCTVACTMPAQRRPAPAAPPVAPAPDRAQEEVQEKDHLARLERTATTWDERLNIIIDALEAEIQESAAVAAGPLGRETHETAVRTKALLSSYLEGMKRLKVYQQRLKEKDKALSREIVYWDLIDRYLSTLRQAEDLRHARSLETSRGVDCSGPIKRAFQQGNYVEAIELYRRSGAAGGTGAGDDTLYYAVSLARTDQALDAAVAASALLREAGEITASTAPLWYELGEWLVNTGQTAQAQQLFQRLLGYYENEQQWYAKVKAKAALFGSGSQDLAARNRLDQALEVFDRTRDFAQAYALALEARTGCPDFSCQQQAQSALNRLIAQGTALLDRELGAIDAAIATADIPQAWRIVASLKESFPGEDYPPAIREKLVLVREREGLLQRRGGRQSEAPGVDSALNEANALIEAQKYEEAIARLEQLQGGVSSAEAQLKKQEAIDGLARSRRLKAGQLFLQAQRTGDQELKKKYLVESYRMLKGIMDAYPSNSLADKIQRNLEDVRREILRVDPAYFSTQTAPETGSSGGERGALTPPGPR